MVDTTVAGRFRVRVTHPDAALLRLEGVGHELPPPAGWHRVVTVMLRHTSGDYELAELPMFADADSTHTLRSTRSHEDRLFAQGVADLESMLCAVFHRRP